MQHKPLRKLPPTHTLKRGIQQSGRFTRNTATDGVGPWQVIPQDAGYISLLPKAAIGRDDVILDLGRQQGWWVNVRCFGEVGNERHRQFLFKSLLCQQCYTYDQTSCTNKQEVSGCRAHFPAVSHRRSEERRVGKECRSRWWTLRYKKKSCNELR